MSGYKPSDFIEKLRRLQQERIDEGVLKDECFDENTTIKKPLFDCDIFMGDASDDEWRACCRFTNDQLTSISKIIEMRLTPNRGPNRQCSVKSILFVALVYFSSNQQLYWVGRDLGLKKSTLMSYITTARDIYFPILYEAEIGDGRVIPCTNKFQHYPMAVGALDTTLIEHYQPKGIDAKSHKFSTKHQRAGFKLQALVNPDGIAFMLFSQ